MPADDVGVLNAQAEAFRRQGRLSDAYQCCLAVLRLRPDVAQAHFNVAFLANELGQPQVAAQAYREALRLDPTHLESLVNYGLLAQAEGKLDEALACFDTAARLRPDLAIVEFNRAGVLQVQRRLREAADAYRRALRLDPNDPRAYNNLASLLNEIDQPDAAVECCLKGLQLQPDSSTLHGNLAIALQAQGRGQEAIAHYRKSVALAPDDSRGHSHLLYNWNFDPECSPQELFAEHLAWAARFAEPLTRQAAPHTNDRAPQRRLRVGYVSPHFRRHAVSIFVEPLLAAHDHESFEIFCYSAAFSGDDVTARIKLAANQWRDVGPLSDEQIAQQVRDDRIDILVDLAGHIGQNRLPVFARKPAPIQVAYLGYQNTTGMSAMDYRLTDAWADPPELTDALYTEKLVRLPGRFFCYRPHDDAPAITPLPATGSGRVTFGSFNAVAKISPCAIAAWLAILARVAGSRLLVLGNRGGYLERHLHELAERAGVDPRRVELLDRCPTREYLERVRQADIALDPFPFNGHTTTCDALWMGVPVVMLAGATYASRFGGSALAAVGLEDLIAESVAQYIDKAVALAADVEALARLRGQLRPRIIGSALVDHASFARSVEHAYRQMWLTWCR